MSDIESADQLSIDSVTGVDVALPIAGVGGRSFAFVIDWHIRVLFAVAWWVIATLLFSGGASLVGAGSRDGAISSYFFVVVLPALVIYFLYHPVLEIMMHGRTPGKRYAGVRIVTRLGATPGVGALLIRNVFRLVDALPAVYCVGLVTAVVTAQHVRVGDLAAGTLLVYEHAPVPERAAMAGGLDPRTAELIEDLLARWNDLDRYVRQDLARTLLQRLDPAAPSGLSDRDLQAQLKEWLTR